MLTSYVCRQRDKEIQRELRQEKKKQAQEIKLLLLGAGESGKFVSYFLIKNALIYFSKGVPSLNK